MKRVTLLSKSITKLLTISFLACFLIMGCITKKSRVLAESNYPKLHQRILSEQDMSYFVHPTNGNDNNSGTSVKEAWKTFRNVNRLRLTAGNTLHILAPGDIRESLVIVGEGTLNRPITIEFAPGIYPFYPKNAYRTKFHISNTNDAPDSLKAVALYFNQCKNIHINGNSAEIVIRGKVMETVINDSENIEIHNISFDYFRPTVSEISVIQVTENFTEINIHEDSWYTIVDGKLLWQGEGWEHYAQKLWQVYDPVNQNVARIVLPIQDLSFQELANKKVRINYDKNPGFTEGLTYQNRNTFRDYAAFFINRSRDIRLRNVKIHFMHGMGIVSQFSENIAIDALSVMPKVGSGRTCAAWADILHFSGCKGEIKIVNSLLSAANDDAINVHGTHLRITETISDRQIQVSFMHPQTYGFGAFAIGDSIEFINAKTLIPYAKNQVAKVQNLNDKDIILTLSDEIPSPIESNDVIENITWTPNVSIRNCQIKFIPTRGILVTTRGRVNIKNNTFKNTKMSAILISNDANNWFESGYVRDVSIENNIFSHCGSPVINVHPENAQAIDDQSVHKNLKITNNTFQIDKDDLVLSAKSTANISFNSNDITSDFDSSFATIFNFRSSQKVEIKDNSWNGKKNKAIISK